MKDPLKRLVVLDRVEVGPARVEPRRVIAPYRVEGARGRGELELIFRFEEDVFVPGEPASENLAAMMAAQPALNYGLFTKRLVFHGPHDPVDRTFLEAMAENTAREILVKKFLEPNPFLVPDLSNLDAPPPRKVYGQARLDFVDEAPDKADREGRSGADREGSGWGGDPDRVAVLSSGGKDSLLSFGLLDEIGCEAHPVFVNESGRHWFTALNAYRHFRDRVPRTARVWTNADRIFNGMLRHLPFIRGNFASLRSDDYPVRLWTVAVFLFAALPVLRKRAVGRLVIGNEYDTTRRATTKGIAHYDGLYDQSRHFDQALTRYFHDKGWGVSQFSVLRPLSEILIQKMLIERYPRLQRLQVSCHAAHRDGDRMRPCGRCEKCRRIAGMITALGASPGACGYAPSQVKRLLADLARHGIHQEKEGADHLGHLLHAMGRLDRSSTGLAVRERPEVMRLRFDRDHAPPEAVPLDLRARLIPLFLKHAEGTLHRVGRQWIETDPLRDPPFLRPYPFESKEKSRRGKGGPGESGKAGGRRSGPENRGTPEGDGSDWHLGGLTWPDARARLRQVDVGLLPVGAIEQHGPHLPLDTDAYDAEYLAREVARRCSDPKPLVLPLMPYGVSYHHEDFAGTLSVSPETLYRVVYEVGMDLARQGVTKLVIVNGHGGNGPALHFAAQMINRDAHIFTCVDTGESSDADVADLIETPNDVHAGEIETSTTLAIRPEAVRSDAAVRFVPRFSNRYLDFTSKRSVGWYAHVARISPKGVLGDPLKATREKGERIWDIMIRRLVELVESIKPLSLNEIYQRRY